MDFSITYYDVGQKVDKPKLGYGEVSFIGYKYFMGSSIFSYQIYHKEDIPVSPDTISSPVFRNDGTKYEYGFFDKINSQELKELYDNTDPTSKQSITKFYNSVSEYMKNNGAYGEIRWKLLKYNSFIIPKYRNIGELWNDECKALLDEIHRIKNEVPEEDWMDEINNYKG